MWPVDLVPAFVNTRTISHRAPDGVETLGAPGDLDRWAAALGIGGTPASTADLAIARDLREGLRAELARHNDAEVPADAAALERLDRVLPELSLRAVRDDAALVATSAAGLVLAAAVRARIDGSWDRLKVCREPLCREAYRDVSRNRSRSWCSMEVCGARSKQRAFVDRRRAARG